MIKQFYLIDVKYIFLFSRKSGQISRFFRRENRRGEKLTGQKKNYAPIRHDDVKPRRMSREKIEICKKKNRYTLMYS